MRKKNPKKTIFLSDAPNRLKGYEWFEDTTLAELYNYAPIIHDAWVFLAAVQRQMIKLYENEKDFPEDLRGMYEEDLSIIIDWLKSWSIHKLHRCSCGRSISVDLPCCTKCMEGKTGWRLKEYVESYSSNT
jgi:hypothetical protein